MADVNSNEKFEELVFNCGKEKIDTVACVFGTLLSATLAVGGTILCVQKGDIAMSLIANLLMMPATYGYLSGLSKSIKNIKKQKLEISKFNHDIDAKSLSPKASKKYAKILMKQAKFSKKVDVLRKKDKDDFTM